MNNITAQIEKLLLPRFLNYVRYDTESCRHSEETPSTLGQWDLARVLYDELTGLGLKDVKITDRCYVIARLPSSPGKEIFHAWDSLPIWTQQTMFREGM